MTDAIPFNTSIDAATRLNRLGEFALLLGTAPPLTVQANTNPPVPDLLGDLYQLCCQDGWELLGFDWRSWSKGKTLIQDRSEVSTASADDLARLLTLLIRKDRFCEGTWEGAYKSGLLFAIAQRAKEIAGTMNSRR